MGTEKRVHSFRLSDAMMDELEQYAKRENRKISNLVETILLDYLAKRRTEESENERNG